MTLPTDRTISAPEELQPLLGAIRARMKPDSIWLFGSRARGDHCVDSDWDICVALPDDADRSLLDPLVGWELSRHVGVPATIVAAPVSELVEGWGAVNTLGFELARDARRVAD